MSRWLLKTEPEEYSWQDLVNENVATWDGVRAPVALKNMRAMKKGDEVFIYHTGKERAVVGMGQVVEDASLDPNEEDPRYVVVKIAAGEPLTNTVTLSKIKESNLFPKWELVRLPRLSIVPVSEEQWEKILEWGV